MSEAMVEMKEMMRINQQASSVQEFHSKLPSSIPNASLQSMLSSSSASASISTAQASNQTPLFLSNYKFPTASTVHEVLQMCCEANPAKGVTLPLKSMTQEENRHHPKTSKKVSWWKSFTICECEKLGGKSGNIEERRFLNEWKDYLDQNKSLTSLRDMMMNKNNSKLNA